MAIMQELLSGCERSLTPKRFLPFHLFLCSLGLVGMTQFLSRLIAARLFPKRTDLVLNDYIIPFFYANKPLELFHYILAIMLLMVYYVTLFLVTDRLVERLRTRSTAPPVHHTLLLLAASIATNLTLLNPVNTAFWDRFVFGLIAWLTVLVLPFIYHTLRLSSAVDLLGRISHRGSLFFKILLALLCTQFIHMFLPFVLGPLQVMNSFLDIPEHTLLDASHRDSISEDVLDDCDNDSSKLCIDNISFINNHFLFGNLNRYSIKTDGKLDPYPKAGTFVNGLNFLSIGSYGLDAYKNQDFRYYVNDRVQAFTTLTALPLSMVEQLSTFLTDTSQKDLLDTVYASTNQMEEYLKTRNLSSVEQEFLKVNSFEIHWQILNRWMIHHHNFVLGPVNEYSLGRELKDLNMQYGLLSVVLTKELLNAIGGITYPNYFRVLYSIYYLYYALFILISALIFRNIRYVLIIGILCFAVLNAIGFHFLYIAPGLNPVRHFFDIFVILFFFLHVRTKRTLYLYLAVSFGLLGILNNSQVGLFCYLSLLIAFIIKVFFENQFRNSFTYIRIITFVIFGLAIYMVSNVGNPGISPYYLKGLLGFPFKYTGLLVACCAFVYYLLILTVRIDPQQTYLPIFLFSYSQGLLIYYVWGTSNFHFLNFACIYTLTAISIIYMIFNTYKAANAYERHILTLLIIFSLLFYVRSVVLYYKERIEYDTIFRSHMVYDWNFDKMPIRTTMPPQYFSNSLDLIHKYSPEPGLYIISKYDSIIPFLSTRYSKMPFFELSYYLVTPKETQECIDLIKRVMPEYLFVDTDIDRHFNVDIICEGIPELDYLHKESVWRVERLNLLKEIFNAVRDDYGPVEEGYLITVYRRKPADGFRIAQNHSTHPPLEGELWELSGSPILPDNILVPNKGSITELLMER